MTIDSAVPICWEALRRGSIPEQEKFLWGSMPPPFSWGPRSGAAGVVRSEEMGRQLSPDIGLLFLVLPTLSTRSPGLMCFLRRSIFPSHQLLLMGLQQCVPSPSGSPFHNADLWAKVGGNKPSPLPLLSPTPASLPVLCPPLQLPHLCTASHCQLEGCPQGTYPVPRC